MRSDRQPNQPLPGAMGDGYVGKSILQYAAESIGSGLAIQSYSSSFFGSGATMTGVLEVPEGHYAEDNMKDTVVPNRNKIFSSIIQAVALSLATKDLGNGQLEKRDVKIALGIHSGDHSIYPDCRQEFRDADMEAFRLGNWDSDLVQFYTNKINEIKTELADLNKRTKNKVTKIKINEIISIITPPLKNAKITDNDLVDLLQYYDLINELETVNE